MNELQAKLDQVQDDILQAKYRGDYQKAAELEEQEAQLLAKMDEVSKQEAQQTIIESVADPSSTFVLAVSGFEANFRALAAGEDEYQMLSITTQLYLAKIQSDHDAEVKAIKDSYESELEAEKNSRTSLSDELAQTRDELADTRTKLDNATNQITDLELERDNAVSDTATYKKQIEEFREQANKTNVPTNLDGAQALAEIKARLEAKKIPVYNKHSGDAKGSYWIASLAETGEEIEIRPYYVFDAKYREVTAEEAATFRAQVEADKAAYLESIPEASEPVVEAPPITFPNTEVTAGGLVGDSAVQESVQTVGGGSTETVTRAEFEALVKRVEELEGGSQAVAA